jgi:hypothetical protein
VTEISMRRGAGVEVPAGCEAARVARVDRGLLTVLTATGERRIRVGGGLHDGTAPAVGDWVAVRGEVAVAIDRGELDPARFAAWRKLLAEAHRQGLRADARARSLEQARLRAVMREFRARPAEPRR